MKKYLVNVNGKSYEVEVEEIGGSASSEQVLKTPVARPQQPQPRPATQPQPQPQPQLKPEAKVPEKPGPGPAGGITVEAPMPGAVLDVKVAEGDTVAEGDVLLILESMKMENEITAPSAGQVASVHVGKGTNVNTGDPMIVLK